LRWAQRLDKQERRQPTTQSASFLETVGNNYAQKSMYDPFESFADGYLASIHHLRQPYSAKITY
jgi:hypothetical protein